MAVYDRWHKSHPHPDHPDPKKRDRPCKCGRGRHKLYPTKAHGQGKRWQVRWYDLAGGQPKQNFDERYGDDPDRHAEAFDAKVNAELDAGTYIAPEMGRITLGEWAKLWRSMQVGDLGTLETIDRRLAHIYDVEATPRSKRAPGSSPIQHIKLRDLEKSPTAIQRWIKYLEDRGLAPSTMKVTKDYLSTIIQAAIDDGRMNRNPVKAASIKLPPIPKTRPAPWTREMVEAARKEVKRRQKSPAMVDLAAMAGLRESEVFAFAEEDIEFLGRDRKIHVRRQIKRAMVPQPDGTKKAVLYFDLPKYGKERDVPLSDTLAARLAVQIKLAKPIEVTLPWGRPDGKPRTFRLLFVGPSGQPWYGQTFEHTWTAARKAAGAPPPPNENGRFHGLRHTFASMELSLGADIRKLAAWLGHEDPGFTLRTYTHLMPDTTDVGRRAVDEFFRAPDDRPSALDVPSEGEQ